MAWICPRCKRLEAVAHVENGSGLHPFPCLFCDYSTLSGPALGSESGSCPCTTADCRGRIADTFGYDANGRLAAVERQPCASCGSPARTKASMVL